MMKIDLETIKNTFASTSVKDARKTLKSAIGKPLTVSGTIERVVRRDRKTKVIVSDLMRVFADFTHNAETVKKHKLRKGKEVKVKGKILSFGYESVCLTKCEICEK